MPIRRSASGSLPPLFCVHGEPLLLARQLRADRHVYALNCVYGLTSVDEAPLEIDELARLYIDAMRTVQPSGPYFLYGFCAGAMVAYEVAQQLIRSGESVGHLLLASPSVSGMGSIDTATAIVRSFGSQGITLARLRTLGVLAARMARQLPSVLGMKLNLLRYTLAGPMPPELMMEVHLLRLRPARQQYRYQPLPCPIEVIYGALSADQLASACEVWTQVTGGSVKVHTVPQAVAHMDLYQHKSALELTARVIDNSVEPPDFAGCAGSSG